MLFCNSKFLQHENGSICCMKKFQVKVLNSLKTKQLNLTEKEELKSIELHFIEHCY